MHIQTERQRDKLMEIFYNIFITWDREFVSFFDRYYVTRRGQEFQN